MGPIWSFTKSVSTVEVKVAALYDSVAPEFFRLLRVPVAEGREFDWHDDETAPRVAILSESLASRLFPYEDAIGRRVDFGESEKGKGLTVVGVVRDANFWRPQSQLPMAIYLPLMQVCHGCTPLALIRTAESPLAIARASERTVQSMGYQYSVRTQSLEERFNKMLAVEHLSSCMSVAFGGAALLITSLGLYGLISYVVRMRYTEIGIRIALGASRSAVILFTLYDTFLVVSIGVLIGVTFGWATFRLLANKYANVSHSLFSGMLCASLILLLTTFVAGYVPALRASRIDPVSALRNE